MKETQKVMIEACGSVYLMFEIDWNANRCCFKVTSCGREEVCETPAEAHEAFKRMIRKQ